MQLEWNKLEYPRAMSMIVYLLVVLVGWFFCWCSTVLPRLQDTAVRRKKEMVACFRVLFKDASARNILQKCNFSY